MQTTRKRGIRVELEKEREREREGERGCGRAKWSKSRLDIAAQCVCMEHDSDSLFYSMIQPRPVSHKGCARRTCKKTDNKKLFGHRTQLRT